jgi:uncharacterized coiled-coil DUF342 family protein
MQPYKYGQWVKHSHAKKQADALHTELERVKKDRDAHADLSERMKVALNRFGVTDSYVEWAKECRKAYDDLQVLRTQRDELVKKCEHYKNLLEDVVNELRLSESAIQEHGPLGTEPSILVRLVLQEKDRTIRYLEHGLTRIKEQP